MDRCYREKAANYPQYGGRGIKVCQLVVLPCVIDPIELVDDLEETERGDAGFGSTGR
jgi:dUTPase